LAIRVQVKDNEPVEKAMRRLKRLCNNEGVDRRFKSRKFYEKPSERRRRKAKERMKTIRLANRARGMA
jgi:small subunit ribosomal protein S21